MKVRVCYTVEIADEEIEILQKGYGYANFTKRGAVKAFLETEGTTALEDIKWEETI